jgi:hypothetical protein
VWEGPIKKYNERILDIKRGQASVVLNTLTYNVRVAPVMSYVAQLMPLPKTFQERFGMLSILRCCNCMRHSDLVAIQKLGGPKTQVLRSLLHCRPYENCFKNNHPLARLDKAAHVRS